MGEQILDAPTLWGLIEARAAATPDAVMAVDEIGREMTFASYRDQVEVAAAGLATDHGIGAGDVITWQLPTWLESMVLVGAISRLGATQNPVLPIYREREVGFCARQAGAKLLVVPSDFGGFDYVGMAQKIADESPPTRVAAAVLTPTARCPPVIRHPAAAPASGDDVRWLFYTSGTTADPKGARHTDRTIYGGEGHGVSAGRHCLDRSALAFPFTHIGGITWLFTSMQSGMGNILFQAFIPDTVVGAEERGSRWPARAPLPPDVPGRPEGRRSPDLPRGEELPRRRRPKPVELYWEMKDQFGAPIVSATG
jgi:acyl-coenzyme A synthetase/AMP-(fatty) acid ligase